MSAEDYVVALVEALFKHQQPQFVFLLHDVLANLFHAPGVVGTLLVEVDVHAHARAYALRSSKRAVGVGQAGVVELRKVFLAYTLVQLRVSYLNVVLKRRDGNHHLLSVARLYEMAAHIVLPPCSAFSVMVFNMLQAAMHSRNICFEKSMMQASSFGSFMVSWYALSTVWLSLP